jgi:hypothetical protein
VVDSKSFYTPTPFTSSNDDYFMVDHHAAIGGTNRGTKKGFILVGAATLRRLLLALDEGAAKGSRIEIGCRDRRLCGRDAVIGAGRLLIYRQVLGRVKPKDPGASARINRNVFHGRHSIIKNLSPTGARGSRGTTLLPSSELRRLSKLGVNVPKTARPTYLAVFG